MTDLLCYGEVLWDDYGTEKRIGGAPFNVCAIGKLIGLKSLIITAVGKDKNGQELKEEIDRLGVPAICQESEKPTGVSHVRLNEKKQPDFKIDKDSAYDYIEFNSKAEQAVKKAKVICFGSLAQRNEKSRNTLSKMLEIANGITVYDVNLRKAIERPKEIIIKSLPKTDILKVNEYELEEIKKILKNEGDEKSFLVFLIKEFSIKKIFITKGADGASLYTSDKKQYAYKPPEINAIDTTGCAT